ncbi:MAG TPA: zinc ribbon domain-containing protein [Vicinamibacterales bacterium]|jgi:hypothetical protein
MSSAISTKDIRPLQADASLRPWQFFVLAGLGCATAVTFLARGQGLTVVVLLGLMMAATTIVGLAVLRAVRPLVSTQDDRTAMIGQRTRVALEREKILALRSIKELEFDRAMGKVSESDFQEMSGRLRTRASRLMRQLDAGGGYREQIERDVAKRLEGRAAGSPAAHSETPLPTQVDARPSAAQTGGSRAEHACAACATVNDPDARFCKACGQRL